MKISERHIDSRAGRITAVRLENASGAWVELSSLGAGIIGLGVPDRNGNIENVALAYADPADYLDDGPCMGKVPGRYANRIAGGVFSLGGKTFRLAVNNGPNALHGGPTGFMNRIWDTALLPEGDGVCFSYVSTDGEEGYPGRLEVHATYRWSDDNTLSLSLEATTDAPTIINLTNHAYWNLDGADSGSVLDHTLRLHASQWLPTDQTLVPTGKILSVDATPMDFLSPHRLGERIGADFPSLHFGKGYDNCWVIDNPGKGPAAELKAARSGRILRISTDQPGVQVYTGNWLAGSPSNHSGKSYEDYDGVAIEAQGFPDAPNRPEFPSQTLTPDQTYRRHIDFKFLTE